MVTRDQVLAAYSVGMLLNELNWHCTQAWLLFEDVQGVPDPGDPANRRREIANDHATRASRIFHQIGTAVAQVVLDPLARDAQFLVAEQESAWNQTYSASSHVKFLATLDQTARTNKRWHQSLLCAASLPSHSERIMSSLEDMFHDCYLATKHSHLLTALRIGDLVDRGLRPPDVINFLQGIDVIEHREKAQRRWAVNPPYREIVERFADDVPIVTHKHRLRSYANWAVSELDILPHLDWSALIDRWWSDWELAVVRPDLTVLESKIAPRTERQRVFDQLVTRVQIGLQDSLCVNYLGLVFFQKSCELEREGYDGRISFLGCEQQWQLLKRLTDNCERFESGEDLCKLICPESTPNNIARLTRDIREKLRTFGINIPDGRKRGYRLEPL